jgi:hypothetical protein
VGVLVVAGARFAGSRAGGSAEAEAEREARLRAAGVPNRLAVVNMLDVPVQVTIRDVERDQWGLTPPDDEPPAGLEGLTVEPRRVSGDATLRPLRIVDGGGEATFTIEVSRFWPEGRSGLGQTPLRTPIGTVPTRSNTLEYCGAEECFDGYGWFDWQDAPDPPLDVFRRCVEVDRVIGTFIDATGATRPLYALFQCDATRFQSNLVLHD